MAQTWPSSRERENLLGVKRSYLPFGISLLCSCNNIIYDHYSPGFKLDEILCESKGGDDWQLKVGGWCDMNMKNLGLQEKCRAWTYIPCFAWDCHPKCYSFSADSSSITDPQDFSLAKILRMEFLNSAPLMAFCQRHEWGIPWHQKQNIDFKPGSVGKFMKILVFRWHFLVSSRLLTTITALPSFRFPLLIRASCPPYGQVGGSAGREWPWWCGTSQPQASYQCLQSYQPIHRGRTSPTVHILSISVPHQICIPKKNHAMPCQLCNNCVCIPR